MVVNWFWVVLSSAVVAAAVKGVLDIIVKTCGSKGQFKRDAAHIAGVIFERQGKKEVDEFVTIYEDVLEKVYEQDC